MCMCVCTYEHACADSALKSYHFTEQPQPQAQQRRWKKKMYFSKDYKKIFLKRQQTRVKWAVLILALPEFQVLHFMTSTFFQPSFLFLVLF